MHPSIGGPLVLPEEARQADIEASGVRPSRFTLVLNALHVLTHAVIDGETAASRRAVRTLRVLALSEFGLASDADLP
jgi:hypothetical protein